MGFRIVIPARHASSRLPGKPLLDIAGRPMILRVLDQARLAGADEVWVATDHAGIAERRAAGWRQRIEKHDLLSGPDQIEGGGKADHTCPDHSYQSRFRRHRLLQRALAGAAGVKLLCDANGTLMKIVCRPGQ